MSLQKRFEDSFSKEKSLHILKELTHAIDRTGRYNLLLERSDYFGICRDNFVYSDYADHMAVIADRQIHALYAKNTSIDSDIDTRQVALTTFIACENKCAEVNSHIRARKGQFYVAADHFNVAQEIELILGDLPSLAELKFSFGPGSNIGCNRFTSTRAKLKARPTITNGLIPLFSRISTQFPYWDNLRSYEIVSASRLSFVPKNAKTDRPITVEPMLNSFFQKGIGSCIRSRLREFGLDLNTSDKVNQKLARAGSIYGNVATIDLSSASDMISLEVIRSLLPPRWFDLLYASRTPVAKYPDGTYHELEKFSGMGNGYTFELESLIFYAIARVVCGRKAAISVFGDDIVIESQFSDDLMAMLTNFGFEVNFEKSFTSGPFRESCGKDFFDGILVRPIYVKDVLSIKELFRIHNHFVRSGYDDWAEVVIRFIPKRFRLYGPDGFGDGHLIDRTFVGERHKNPHFSGWIFSTFLKKAKQQKRSIGTEDAAFIYATTNGSLDTEISYGNPAIISKPSLASQSIFCERDVTYDYKLKRIYYLGNTPTSIVSDIVESIEFG